MRYGRILLHLKFYNNKLPVFLIFFNRSVWYGPYGALTKINTSSHKNNVSFSNLATLTAETRVEYVKTHTLSRKYAA